MANSKNFLRLLLCTNAYPPDFIGGAELIAHYQAKQFLGMGMQVQVLAGDGTGRRPRHSVTVDDYEGLTVHRVALCHLDYDNRQNNFIHHEVENYFAGLLEDFRPDIVHCHNIVGLSVRLLLMARQAGAVTSVTLHDHWGYCLKNTILRTDNEICRPPFECSPCLESISDGAISVPIRLRQDFIQFVLSRTDVLISPSCYLAAAYREAGLDNGRLHAVMNGIDVERFSRIARIPCPDLRFTFIGHFGEHKGIRVLLEAIRLLGEKYSALFNLVGDGHLVDHAREFIKANGLKNKVRLWGKVANSRIEEVYAQTDVLILPSIWPENQPVSITEAMAAGIPVIGSNLGGCSELIVNGVSGFLFEAGNVDDLAEKIRICVRDREKVRSLGEAARNRMSSNTYRAAAEKYLSLYEKAGSKNSLPVEHPLIPVFAETSLIPFQSSIALLNQNSARKPFFARADWLTMNLSDASFFWVIDCENPLKIVELAQQHEKALLVPAENQTLKNFCVSRDSGLYWNGPLEGAVCLEFMLDNPGLVTRMGRNAGTRGSIL